MSRLFDAGKEAARTDTIRRRREEVRARAAAVDAALQEYQELDETGRKIREQLAETQSVQPVRYTEFRAPGSRWMIEHARDGDDYVYQLFPLRATKMEWKDVVLLMIAEMDAVFPRTVKIKYAPPSGKYQVRFFTIRVENVARLPGWEDAAKNRALKNLSAVNAW